MADGNDPSDEETGHPERVAGSFFGRRKGKALTPLQAGLFETLLPRLLIDIDSPCPRNVSGLFSHAPARIDLEIGFGGAEHLLHRAGLNPGYGFIGCEPFVNGMAKALAGIAEHGLSNIRLYDQDAARLLDWLPAGCLDRADLLYPDPWPKKRHWKRRFVSQENLARLHRVLKPGGEFRFASDIENYVDWTIAGVGEHGGFVLMTDMATGAREPWPEWITTRYERKAIREGRSPAYLIFKRI